MTQTHLYLLITAGVAAVAVGGWCLLIRQRTLSRRDRDKAVRWRREEAAGIPPRPQDYGYAIGFDSAGLTLTNLRRPNRDPLAIRWSEIERVVAFKRDMYVVDCLCLRLSRSDGHGVELNEEMARWNSLVEALPRYLPGCLPFPAWFHDVAFPPFATNELEIYSRTSPATVAEIRNTNSR